MRFFHVLVCAGLLSGCASYKALLVNKDGNEMVCQGESTGILFPHIVAKDKFDKCVKEAESKGYKVKSQE